MSEDSVQKNKLFRPFDSTCPAVVGAAAAEMV